MLLSSKGLGDPEKMIRRGPGELRTPTQGGMSTPMEELCNLPPPRGEGKRMKRLKEVLGELPQYYSRRVQSAAGRQPAVISEAAYDLLRQKLDGRLAVEPANWLLRVHETTLNEGLHQGGWFYFNPLSWQNETGFFGEVVSGAGVSFSTAWDTLRSKCCAEHYAKHGTLCPTHPTRPPHNYIVRLMAFQNGDYPACYIREPPTPAQQRERRERERRAAAQE